MNKRIMILIPVLLIGSAVTWYALRNGSAATRGLTASGTVEATDADLGFQAPGRVLSLPVREGDAVSAGDVLGRLDARELEAALAGALAQLEATEARLAELQRGARPQELATAESSVRSAVEQSDAARRNAVRSATLFEGGAVSRQTMDQAQTAWEVASAGLEQAREQLALVREGPRVETIRAQRAAVEQARANVDRAEAAVAYTVITAPFSGVVTERHREPGEAVQAGAPVLTLLDPDDRWVRIYIREDEIGAVRLGAAAEIASDTYPGRTYPGEVIFIGSQAEFTPRNVQTAEERIKLVYPVKVRITGDPNFELKPGIPADVTLVGAGA